MLTPLQTRILWALDAGRITYTKSYIRELMAKAGLSEDAYTKRQVCEALAALQEMGYVDRSTSRPVRGGPTTVGHALTEDGRRAVAGLLHESLALATT